MPVPQIDWLAVWKIYRYPHFFWTYTSLNLLVRFLTLRLLNLAKPKTWLLSTASSVLLVPAVPFVALPTFALVALVAGQAAVHSLLMAFPIALFVGISGCLMDGLLLRLLLGNAVGRRRIWYLFGINLLVAFLAVGGVVTLMLVHPPEVIARVNGSQ
jgi:hypothetical protein